MFTISSARPAAWVMVALLTLTTAIVTCDVAAAAELGTAPDAKKSNSATLKITPDKHDFGKVIVPLTSAPETITVTNTSKSASVEFTTIVAAPPFSIQSDGCSGSPLAAGAICQVAVVFSPTITGKVKKKNGLTLSDSAKKSPQDVRALGPGRNRSDAYCDVYADSFSYAYVYSIAIANRRNTNPDCKRDPNRYLHAKALSDSGHRASRLDLGRSSLRWHSAQQRGSLQPGH